VAFWSYVIASLQSKNPAIGVEAQAYLQSPQMPAMETILVTLINDLAQTPGTKILVLDDFHLIRSQATMHALSFLIDRLPAQLCVVILAWSDPMLPLALLRGRGQLVDIRADDLRFSIDEARSFLNASMGLDLAPQAVEALNAKTEGWAAGLQMAAASLRGCQSVEEFISSFSGSNRFILDYLIEEVLRRQPPEIQAFLLSTSILNTLCGPLCDALLWAEETSCLPDAQKALEYLESCNLFIIPLDEERYWYRYHHLFADLLRRNLAQVAAPETIHDLYARAIQWHQRNGFPDEAIEYALAAGDFERAACLVEQGMERLFRRNSLTTLQHWAASLPNAILARHPFLCSGLAWAANATNHPQQCEELIRLVETRVGMTVDEFLALDDENRGKLPEETLGMLIEPTVQRARLALDRGDPAAVSAKYISILPYLTSERDSLPFLFSCPSSLRPPMEFMIALAQELQGNAREAASGYENAVRSGQEIGNMQIIALSLGHLGQVQMMLGDLCGAEATFHRAVEIHTQQGGQPSAFFGLSHVGLGNLAYERNDLETARQELERGIVMGHLWNSWEALIPGYLGLAQLHFAQGDIDGALQALDELGVLGKNNPIMVSPIVDAWKASSDLRRGMAAKAEGWARQAGYLPRDEVVPVSPDLLPILARLLLARGNAEQAQSLLEEQINSARSTGQWGVWLKLSTLLVVILDARKQHRSALEKLLELLRRAKDQRYIRALVDEGEPMRRMIADCRLQTREPATLEYIDLLLAAFATPPSTPTPSLSHNTGLAAPLSPREVEVLRLVAEGFSNKEIAQKLCISLRTVKYHTTSIFTKLNVNSRTQAVSQARAVGII